LSGSGSAEAAPSYSKAFPIAAELMVTEGSGSYQTRRWRKPDSNSQSHLNEKPFLGR